MWKASSIIRDRPTFPQCSAVQCCPCPCWVGTWEINENFNDFLSFNSKYKIYHEKHHHCTATWHVRVSFACSTPYQSFGDVTLGCCYYVSKWTRTEPWDFFHSSIQMRPVLCVIHAGITFLQTLTWLIRKPHLTGPTVCQLQENNKDLLFPPASKIGKCSLNWLIHWFFRNSICVRRSHSV